MLILLFEYQNLYKYPNELSICCSPSNYLSGYHGTGSYTMYATVVILSLYIRTSQQIVQVHKKVTNKNFPIPGIEPGPPG